MVSLHLLKSLFTHILSIHWNTINVNVSDITEFTVRHTVNGLLVIICPLQQAQDDCQTTNIAAMVITSQPPSQLAMSSRINPPRDLVADMKLAAGTCPTGLMRLSGGRRGMSGLHLWPPCHLPGYRHQSYTSYQPSILSEGWPWCGPQPGQDFCAVGRWPHPVPVLSVHGNQEDPCDCSSSVCGPLPAPWQLSPFVGEKKAVVRPSTRCLSTALGCTEDAIYRPR